MESMITNGPYLLAPSATGIVIAWEMAENLPVSLKVQGQIVIPELKQELPCPKYPAGAYIYIAVLTELQADTTYLYEICLSDKILATAEFHTQQKNPQKLHLVTLSDSHLFYASDFFAAMVKKEKPDFILHSGDISFGTGYQHEQYHDNWFKRLQDILPSVPVYYVTGNHDDGPYYQSFFADTQEKPLHSPDKGHTFSFNHGNTHFVMTDSNPWGLFEMNAVNSGLEADSKTKKCIHDTLAWIEKDLSSKAAKQAKWKILILHHPYTDEFNNRYIVPLAERCGVNLVISGHLHYYMKAVSINPEVGARTVYVSQGSAQDPEADFTPANPEKRLLVDFPEVVAMGRNNYGVLDIDEEEICYKLYGFLSDGTEKLVDTIHIRAAKPDVKITEAKFRRLDNNGHVEVQAMAKNNGKGVASVVLSLRDNQMIHLLNRFGSEENNQIVLLNGGQQQKISTIYQAKTQGEHLLTADGEQLKIIVFEPTQLSFAHMKLTAGKGEQANSVTACIEATNNLDREIFVSVPLYINQRIAETKNLFFRGHEKKYITFCYKFAQAGNYQISIADQLPKEFYVEGGIRIVPRIHDKSGKGHTALLHGTPKVMLVDGQMEVCLDHYGDYIEILPSTDLEAENSYTGMVWANVKRLAHKNEMGHNPLMVRGKSVGWGATYFLRMVIERTGSLKWGICHDITEYSWQGGEVSLGKMTQYTMTFDKKLGGNSYCDGNKVASVAGIDKKDKIRQWEHEPIFVGYSYIGHVIPEIGRPKYFTHLPGKIGQVRFYTHGLSAEEVEKIRENPTQAGPKKKDLAVWLDFRDILSVGCHQTEWRHPAIYAPDFKTEKKYWRFRQLKAQTVLPLQAGIKTTVEVSDDRETVKGQMKITLKDGTNYIDLGKLPEAQYIRLRTDMTAEVGADGTFVPQLLEYQITAENETDFTNIYWSTRTDWEKGTFTGAAGFAPVDRLRDYPEYTDVIHG